MRINIFDLNKQLVGEVEILDERSILLSNNRVFIYDHVEGVFKETKPVMVKLETIYKDSVNIK